MRLFLELSYDGDKYAGWQRQPNVTTVQGSIEHALHLIFGKDIGIVGCGRTDTGVHATYYIAHCDLDIAPAECDQIIYKLNQILDKDIACHRFIQTSENAHARFDAMSRSYLYQIHFKKSPFKNNYSTLVNYGDKIDIDLLNEVASIVKKTVNFEAFCKSHGSNTTTECLISTSTWSIDHAQDQLSYSIRANRFLRGMVRLIVGSSLSVATRKLSLSDLKYHISMGTRSPLMSSAPACGLALVGVEYPYIKR